MGKLTNTEIDQLNRYATDVARPVCLGTPGAYHALRFTAQRFGLTLITNAPNHCEIYQAKDGRVVNLRREGPTSLEIEPGGAGFDDQIEQ